MGQTISLQKGSELLGISTTGLRAWLKDMPEGVYAKEGATYRIDQDRLMEQARLRAATKGTKVARKGATADEAGTSGELLVIEVLREELQHARKDIEFLRSKLELAENDAFSLRGEVRVRDEEIKTLLRRGEPKAGIMSRWLRT